MESMLKGNVRAFCESDVGGAAGLVWSPGPLVPPKGELSLADRDGTPSPEPFDTGLFSAGWEQQLAAMVLLAAPQAVLDVAPWSPARLSAAAAAAAAAAGE